MKWKKASPELSEHLESALAEFDCQRRKMFGHPAYFARGNLFAGIFGDTIFIRLSSESRDVIFKSFDEAVPFEPLESKVMREYVVLSQSIYDDSALFHLWLGRAFEYASGLTPKPVKKKVKK